jgi:hypothetical protein
VEVGFDASYISNFSDVTFTPSVDTVTDTTYIVNIDEVQPGETRQVSLSLKADAHWRHQGAIIVSPEEGPGAQLSVTTWVFP